MKLPNLVAILVVAATTALALSCGEAAAGGPQFITVITPVSAPFGANSASATSWLAGAHAGYNWQQGPAVFGFETDLQGTNLNSSFNGVLSFNPPANPPPPAFASTSSSIDWYGTLRGRFGYATGQWLFYGTGGLAYGGVSLNSVFTALGLTNAVQASSTKTGWVGGVGVEYLFRPNLSFSLSYQYVDLGTLTAANTLVSQTTGNSLTQSASTHAQFQAVMLGFSWHFAPNGGASPWAGGYVGGHAGGDWGDHTSANYSSSAPPLVSFIQPPPL